MKIIFAGTPHFAEKALQALLDQQANVVAVLTQPDRPAGRGMQLKPSPVKQLALQYGLTVLQPQSLKDADIQQQLAAYRADVMVVAAYGLILPQAVLQTPRLGCLNIHASLLPRWRGAAPVQRAILAGDAETGVTIMQMDAGLDTGAMLLKKTCAIEDKDSAATLHDKLAVLGAEAVTAALPLLEQGRLRAMSQDNALATYAAKLNKDEARLDWTQDAVHLDRAVRGYNPFPGASAQINDTLIRIWQASLREGVSGEPGAVLAVEKNALLVACGNGALSLEILQRPNAKALPAAQFLQGFQIRAGDRFESR
ncbi:MAG: methionyl-tRNA formyltransferase [Gallionellaceae bacterium]|nr:MAG: methionyl-tRNA formyltransferase [Gallionellaceae bacterium]